MVMELFDFSRDPETQKSDFLKETQRDPFERKFKKRHQCGEGIEYFLVTSITFALGVTLAIIVHITLYGQQEESITFALGVTLAIIVHITLYVGQREETSGVVVTNSRLCASLGLAVVRDGGSSVDAAITSALCQGIVQPHISGIGGGGVMLVHDGRKNETMVIDFGETTPARIREEMLQHDLQHKSGLLVGVPGMLSGLHQAHQLYGRISWRDVVVRAANVAKEGFNVSDSLVQAIDSQKGNVSEQFRAMFLPQGRPLPAHFTIKLPQLAAVLDRVASYGVDEFYHGNVSEEITDTVQANGGVLTRADLANYNPVMQKALTSQYKGFQVFVAPPPNAGGALLSFLNIVEGFKFTGQNQDEATHWIAEALKASLVMANGLSDPKFDSSVAGTISNMLSKAKAAVLHRMIGNSCNARLPQHYSALPSLQGGASPSSQVVVMGPDNLIVSLSCSLNRPFGSGLITSSGILLNSQVMNFFWHTGTQSKHNRIQGGRRSLSFLMPTIVRQTGKQCGLSVALGASAGQSALSGIAQVVINMISAHKNLSDSLSEGRLHPSLQGNNLLVDSEIQKKCVQALRQRGHDVHRVEVLSVVLGAERRGDAMCGVTDPRSSEASAQTITPLLGA